MIFQSLFDLLNFVLENTPNIPGAPDFIVNLINWFVDKLHFGVSVLSWFLGAGFISLISLFISSLIAISFSVRLSIFIYKKFKK